VDDKDEEFPHTADRTMTASTFKTARRVRISSYCEFATHALPSGIMLDVTNTAE
jgi:hypothetical protein